MRKKVLIPVKHTDRGVIWQQFPGKFISINGQTISEGIGNTGKRKATKSQVNPQHYDANLGYRIRYVPLQLNFTWVCRGTKI
jgi:hypothetical protein